MKKRLARVAPLQLGIVLAVLYGLLSLIIIVPMGALSIAFWGLRHEVAGPTFQATAASPALMGGIFGGLMMILLPLLYAAMGFVFGVISGAVYNFVAKLTGGIEVTVVDVLEP